MAGRLRVLVASDDATFLDAAARAARDAGHAVTTTAPALSQLRRVLAARLVDVVVLDCAATAAQLEALIAARRLPAGIVSLGPEDARALPGSPLLGELIAEARRTTPRAGGPSEGTPRAPMRVVF